MFNSHSRASVWSSGSQPQQPVPNLTESPQLHEGSCSQLTAGNSEAAREARCPEASREGRSWGTPQSPAPSLPGDKGAGGEPGWALGTRRSSQEGRAMCVFSFLLGRLPGGPPRDPGSWQHILGGVGLHICPLRIQGPRKQAGCGPG